MQDPRPIIGRVVSVQGTTPGPASGIAYTIACHDANVDGVYRLDGQKPIRRWPDTLDTVAWTVGSIVQGIVDANVVQWHSMEMPDFGACPDNTGQSQMLEMLRNGSGFRNVPNVPGSNDTTTDPGSGGNPNTDPGGGSQD